MATECIVCGATIPAGRKVCPGCEGKNEGVIFEALMRDKYNGFEVKDEIEQAYRQGFEAGMAQIEEKHLSECRQISDYDIENKALKALLKQAVEDIRMIANATCIVGSLCEECPLHGSTGDYVCKWNHEAEALALIGGASE
jgi:hypothetical protein